jgi:hypothetical protein
MAEGAYGLDLHDFSAPAGLSHLPTAGWEAHAESGSLRSLTDHPSRMLRMACTLRGTSAMVRNILYLMITSAPTGRILHKTFAYAWSWLHRAAGVPGGTPRGDPRRPSHGPAGSASRRGTGAESGPENRYNTVAGIATGDWPVSFIW